MQWAITDRPRTLKDLYGLDGIKKYFYSKAQDKDWPKAILLRGQFGNGKSTVAGIVASMMVCQNPTETGDPCGKCASCEAIISERFDRDVIRIDGGQSGKADVVETINEHIATSPMFDSRKVIIIEEVQELSNAARNSLLKTLEHPKSKIHFILLSMESGAASGFVSRCVPFTFKKLAVKDLMFFLKETMESRGLWDDDTIPTEFKTQGLATLAQTSQGSIRLALQLLDMCVSGRFFTKEEILENLGFVDEMSAWAILLKLLALDDSVWESLNKYKAFDFFAIAYSLMADASMFRVSGFLKDEGNPWVVSNIKKVGSANSFPYFLKAFDAIAAVSKPYLRDAEMISILTQTFSKVKQELFGPQKLVEDKKNLENEAIPPVRPVRGLNK